MFEEPAYQWLDPTWRQAAEAWMHEAAARQGTPVIGPITGVRFLPWSAVLRAPTTRGDVYFKACGPSQRHEPALAVFLAEARPDCMIPVLAADAGRGWLLTPDGGPTLAAAIHTPAGEAEHWSRVLALQAGVQRELMPGAGDMLALGVPDRSATRLPDLFDALLCDSNRLLVGRPGALTDDNLASLRAAIPQVRELCAELAAAGPPDTFIHDDFHEDHIFAHRPPDGGWRYTFFDFGDACLGHPFMQLISQPRFAAGRFGIEADAAQNSLREFYLSQWLDFGPLEKLRHALDLALIAGCVIRALTWYDACGDHLNELPDYLRGMYASGIAFWLMQIPRRLERLHD